MKITNIIHIFATMEDKKIIKYNGKEFPASEYQEEVFKFLETGCGNLVIGASAGSAKTTTLVNCMRFIPEDKKVLYVSFNKHIAEEINKKVDNPNAMARTCSSVGYEICRENGIGKEAVDNEKYNDYIRNNILTLTQYEEVASLGYNYGAYMRNIRQLVDLCRYTLNFTIKEIESLAKKYGITPVRDEIEVCRKVLQWGENSNAVIDQTDMVWLPNVLNLSTRRLLNDFIFIDEAQDISIAQQSLIMRCAKRGARIIAVGDRNQQINVWCGSDEAAIDKFRQMANTVELRLPICYRCGKKIIEFANNFSEDKMIPPENAIEGEIRHDVSLSDISVGDMVLARNMAPLIELQQTLLRRNQKVYIQGYKAIREEYLALIENSHSKKIDKNCLTTDGLFPQLYSMLLDEVNRLMNIMGMDEEEALSRASVLTLYDNIEAIKVLSEGLTTVDELVEKIKIIFSGTEENAVLLSTVHRAKGLEADNVFIYRRSILDNNRLATKDWEIRTEQNLRYVAYTRAKKTLNFIEEPWNHWAINPYGGNNLLNELNTIREKINYSKELNISENCISSGTVEHKAENMTIITSLNKSNRVRGGLKFGNLMKK